MRTLAPSLVLLSLTACVGLDTLPAKDEGAATDDSAVFGALVVSDNALDFGTVTVGETASQSLTLRNDGELAVEFLNVQVMDSDAFQLTTTLLGDLEAGAELVMDLQFTPEETGDFAGTLVLETNAVGAEAVNIPLSGSAEQGGGGDDSEVTDDSDEPAGGALSVSASSVDFGTVDIGTTGTQSMTLSNTGDQDLLVKSFTFTASEFSWGKEISVPYVLGAGATRAFSLTFTPDDETPVTGTVTITSDDSSSPAVTIAVKGVGYDRCSICSGDPWVDTGTAGYIDLGLGWGSKLTTSVQVWNNGDMDLTISAINVENGVDLFGLSPGSFSVSGFSGPKVVKPGGNTSFTVSYASPSSSIDGNTDHLVHILSDSTLNPDYTVGLSASCLAETGCK